jgi:hypothetical protein
MVENIVYTVGKSAMNAWRRNNLLKVHGCVEKENFFEVNFQYVEHMYNGVKQVNLTYHIVK